MGPLKDEFTELLQRLKIPRVILYGVVTVRGREELSPLVPALRAGRSSMLRKLLRVLHCDYPYCLRLIAKLKFQTRCGVLKVGEEFAAEPSVDLLTCNNIPEFITEA